MNPFLADAQPITPEMFTVGVVAILAGVVFARFGVQIAARKGRSRVEGAILGLLLGPLGLLIEALCKSRRKRAPSRVPPEPDLERAQPLPERGFVPCANCKELVYFVQKDIGTSVSCPICDRPFWLSL